MAKKVLNATSRTFKLVDSITDKFLYKTVRAIRVVENTFAETLILDILGFGTFALILSRSKKIVRSKLATAAIVLITSRYTIITRNYWLFIQLLILN